MSLLALYFLGSPRVSRDRVTLEIRRRKVIALLVYLAVTAQRHSRDELAEILFGKRDRGHARANLRQTLSLLRSAIGKDQLGADRYSVWLSRSGGLWIDVTEFQRFLKKGQDSKIKADVASEKYNIARAAELFRGEFLSGFYVKESAGFEDWQLLMQESLHRQQSTALKRLAEIHESWGQYEQAIEYGHRRLALDQLEEAAHRHLMWLYSSGGQRFEALRQYDRCRSILERELGEKPNEETDRLRERILSRKLLSKHVSGQEQQLDTRPNNLKVPTTTFIGRERELASVLSVLRSRKARLLMLTGPGGTGKTRLALQATAELVNDFEHGVFFVDFSTLNESNQVVRAITSVLNVRETGRSRRSLLEILKDNLQKKKVLLLLDNFEHVLLAAPQIAELLADCPHLKILATSREALHIQAERIFSVPPMRLLPRGQRAADMMSCEAVQLFAERASAVQSTFELSEGNAELVAEICRCLDGLPLAIELAATHIGVLTPKDLLVKLKDRLNLSKRGFRDLPARQQTLKSEIDWSYELLDASQQSTFRQLSVFSGGCTLDAAEKVCGMPGGGSDVFLDLSSLVEKSLVRLIDVDGESRFGMLETIREYARDRLEESGDLDVVEERFAGYFLRFSEKAELNLYGPKQVSWFDRIERETANIRSALSWLYERRKLEDGLRLAGAMGWFWFRKALFTEGQYWLEKFRTAATEVVLPGPQAKVAYSLGWMKLCVSSVWGNPEGKRYFRESLELWSQSGNQRGVALSKAWLAWKEGDIEGPNGWMLADESVAIARATGDPWTLSWCLKVAFSHLRRQNKDLDSRRAALEEAICLARKTGDPFLLSQTLNGMGNVFSWIRELEAAEPWYRDSLRIAREIGDSWSILDNIFYLADGHLGLGRIRMAKELFAEGLRLSMDYCARGYIGWFMGGFYRVACYEGQTKRAARLGAFSESILDPDGQYDPSFAQRLGIDNEVAAAEWKIGQIMTPENAVAYALMDE